MRILVKYRILVLLIVFSYSTTAQTVYITKTGKKYHEYDCRYLKQSKIKTTLNEALSGEYTARSVCQPLTEVTLQNRSDNPTIKRAISQQCIGTTQAGNRCKRMTTNPNGRYYQH